VEDDPGGRQKTVTQMAKSTVSSAKAQSESIATYYVWHFPVIIVVWNSFTGVGKITHQQLNFPVTRSVQMLRKKLSSSHQAKPDDGVKKRLTQRRLTTTRYTAGLRGLSNCVSGHCSHPRSVYWVQCGRCDLWYHCRCVEIPPQKAKQPDFSCL
jgi:hypothetical protein